jgi:hypothetical protein
MGAQAKRNVVAALIGVAMAVALQLYFVANWDRYVRSIPATRMAQRGGVAPEAHVAGSTRSARDGAMALLVAGIACALLATRVLVESAMFVAGVTGVNVVSGIVTDHIGGNLWPLGLIAVLGLSVLPFATGVTGGGGLRMIVKRIRGRGELLCCVLLLAGLVRCASAPTPGGATPAPGASAELSLIQLFPHPGTTLSRTSIFEATFNYRLAKMKPGATYTLEPTFADQRGSGYTFNAATGPMDVIHLTSPEGAVDMRYPVAREWTSARLARPIELWFQIVEMEPRGGRVLVKTGPYRFEAAPDATP